MTNIKERWDSLGGMGMRQEEKERTEEEQHRDALLAQDRGENVPKGSTFSAGRSCSRMKGVWVADTFNALCVLWVSLRVSGCPLPSLDVLLAPTAGPCDVSCEDRLQAPGMTLLATSEGSKCLELPSHPSP